MSEIKSESSGSESETSACSSKFNPMKALYSDKMKIPVKNAPMYENIAQYEKAQQSTSTVIPVGQGALVRKREEEKERKKVEEEQRVQDVNKKRFANYEGGGMVPTTRNQRRMKNVLSRMHQVEGPLRVLKECVDNRLRVKIVTRNEKGIRGDLQATLVAFDKQWNLALSDVIEVWKRKGLRKRKIPPALGTMVPKGTAATISPVPAVSEKPVGKGVWECTRHIPQLLVRGEHVVLVSVVKRT